MIIGTIYSWRDEDFTPLMCIVFIALIIVLLLGGLSSCFQVVVREYEEKQYNIQGLENNITTSQKTSGAFVLGFGYINSETTEQIKYYYFKVNDIGKQLLNLQRKKLETIQILI